MPDFNVQILNEEIGQSLADDAEEFAAVRSWVAHIAERDDYLEQFSRDVADQLGNNSGVQRLLNAILQDMPKGEE